jgi:glycosyltransferase involved in cell wall biosynthesis
VTSDVVVLIPALNAARSIGPLIAEAKQHVERVLVVDDGSSDGTGDVARAQGAVVIRHDVNRGKGGALKTGFAWVLEQQLDGVITLDADGQHLPRQIPLFLEHRRATGADLIIGGRAHLFDGMLPRRRMANRFSAWAVAKASRTNIQDSQSGYRFYSSRVLREIPLRSEGFDLETEVIIRAGVRGLRVEQIPIDLGFVDGLSTSHFKPLLDTLRIAWTGFRARFVWR